MLYQDPPKQPALQLNPIRVIFSLLLSALIFTTTGFYLGRILGPIIPPEKNQAVTTGKQTYTNKQLGFSFDYPAGYIVEEDKLGSNPGQQLNDPLEYLKISNPSLRENPNLLIFVNNVHFDNSSSNIVYDLQVNGSNQLTINKRTIQPTTVHNGDPVEEISASIDSYGSNNYFFYFRFNQNGNDFEKDFQSILGSFRVF